LSSELFSEVRRQSYSQTKQRNNALTPTQFCFLTNKDGAVIGKYLLELFDDYATLLVLHREYLSPAYVGVMVTVTPLGINACSMGELYRIFQAARIHYVSLCPPIRSKSAHQLTQVFGWKV
jgi:hypothetical protein